MKIEFNRASLRQLKLHDYLTRFVLGGAITVATGLIAKHYGPVIGGLFLAFPAIFPSGATLIEKHELDKKLRAGIPFTVRGRLGVALDARAVLVGRLHKLGFCLSFRR